MEFTFGDRLKHAWDAFSNKDQGNRYVDIGSGSYRRPDRSFPVRGNDKTTITALYNRIALDVAMVGIEHVRLDENGRYLKTESSPLNDRFNLEANLDQTGFSFMQDVVMSMLDEGVVAVVPVKTTISPTKSSSFVIDELRTGRIVDWYPKHVKVNVYNDRTGLREDIVIDKRSAAIIENPFYSVFNEPNSTMQRLLRKLALLDMTDDRNSSGKLDLIIQLPYVIKSESRREQAEKRRKDIEDQLSGSKYGIAYTDGTETITQLNRPIENNLMSQIEYLTSMLYSQLGMSKEILDGTASPDVLKNYYNRTVNPFLTVITAEIKRKFLTKTARSQKQSIMFFRDPFELVSTDQFAEIGDKFTRNAIMTSNELRQSIGIRPSDNPTADELSNKNIKQPESPVDSDPVDDPGYEHEAEEEYYQNEY